MTQKVVNFRDNDIHRNDNIRNQMKKRRLENGIAKSRQSLPVAECKEAIVESIRNNPAVIILSETATGKSTQIPQYLLEAGFAGISNDNNSKSMIIGVTEPRRIAATSLAKRVSEEQNTELGWRVGYAVRFDDQTSKDTQLKFMTDGLLLRELLFDPLLSRYSVIVIDEAHERSVRTDILLGVIKGLIFGRDGQSSSPLRPDLKLVIMSATLDADAFSSYLNNAPVLYIEGRQHKVRVNHSIEPVQDYIDASLVTIIQIHLNLVNMEDNSGDILVFLTGQEDIEILEKLLIEHASDFPSPSLGLCICPLYANLPPKLQNRVFQPTAEGYRKIVLATNVAETSITIPGIKFVLDCGLQKTKVVHYNNMGMGHGIETLSVQPISKSSARQRMGRAGRLGAGTCYRLYTQETFNQLSNEEVPEIRKCSLSGLLLSMACSGLGNSSSEPAFDSKNKDSKSFQCKDLINFDFMDRPSKESLANAFEELHLLGALDDQSQVTMLGTQMAQFPLDPAMAKVLLLSKDSEYLSDVIDVISLLNVENIMVTPSDQRDKATEARRRFKSTFGDHIMLYNILQAYMKECGNMKRKETAQWCRDHYINGRSIGLVMDTRRQLRDYCERIGFQLRADAPRLDATSSLHEQIVATFLLGFPMNVAVLQQDGSYKDLKSNTIVSIHPASSLFTHVIKQKAKAVFYHDLVWTTKKYIRTCSVIEQN
ncbi:hypothetical protein MIR68_008948 [Amoeboaphelidium protococcarum]|nr:hypothetical protein MIR68_008948 [Amoeboaphelidium protococcarum]